MPDYRKKPIAVEARPYTGDNIQELQDWSNDLVALSDYDEDVICAHTLEGPVWGETGDYIIKGVRGELHLRQKDIFEEAHEPADSHGAITIRPTHAKALKRGDLFRNGGRTIRIAAIKRDEEVVVIVYYTGAGSLVNSFLLTPDDTLDKVVDTTNERALVLKKGAIKALAEELLDINRAVNTIIRIAADNGVDPFRVQ